MHHESSKDELATVHKAKSGARLRIHINLLLSLVISFPNGMEHRYDEK